MSVGQWIFVLILLWIALFAILSAVMVKTGTLGAVFRFKKFTRVLQPGLNFVIPVIDRVEYISTQTKQYELPDEPEDIDRIHDIPEEGKRLPFRILHKGMREAWFFEEKKKGAPIDPDDPLSGFKKVRFSALDEDRREAMEIDSVNTALTSEIAVTVEESLGTNKNKGRQFQILQQFIENVEPSEGRTREKEVRKRMEDMVSRTLQEFLGQVTLGHAIERKALFDAILKNRLQVLVGEKTPPGATRVERPWGRNVSEVYIKSFHPGRRVNEARADAAAAVSQKEKTIRDAEAQAKAKELDASAEAFKQSELGRGEAESLAYMAEALKKGGDHALALAQLDVAREALTKGHTIWAPSDVGQIGGILSLGAKIAKKE